MAHKDGHEEVEGTGMNVEMDGLGAEEDLPDEDLGGTLPDEDRGVIDEEETDLM